MISTDQIERLLSGGTVVSQAGEKLGKVGQVFLDDRSGEPEWVTVKTGLFGTAETFVPLDAAMADGDTIRVPYTKDLVKDAPRVDVDQHLSVEEEEQLYRHYSLPYHQAAAGTDAAGTAGTTGTTGTAGTAGTTGHDTAGHDASVVRSEEDVNVGTQRKEAGKVRLRKYVVTDHVTKTVPVEREEVRVEREPVSGGTSTGQLGDDEAEVTLYEDDVVVEKTAKPVERVNVDTDTVTEERTVETDVRKEQVDVDTDDELRR